MPSVLSVAVQSAVLKAAANLTAQTVTQWNTRSHATYDWHRVADFAVFGILSAPLASVWQRLLEDNYPSQQQTGVDERTNGKSNGSAGTSVKWSVKATTQTQLIWRNILIKLLLDQTIGQFLINVTFLICTNSSRIRHMEQLLSIVRTRIFGIIWASWKLWPWVALVNFIWVPVQWRVLVASLVGFGWNIFLSIWSMQKA
jgi:protein Mpv17